MFCTQCGTNLDDRARFCTLCGKSTALAVPDAGGVGAAGVGAAGVGASGWTAGVAGRKLRRIRARKKIAGVCAGFAEYFDMDVTLMRLIWLGLLIMPPNIGAIAYIVAMFVLPKE
jgi:phage shock protein C